MVECRRTGGWHYICNPSLANVYFFMVETKASYPHLEFVDGGLPVIERVNFKVIHLISNHLAHGWSAEELVINFPQLTLGEVYSSLAWFADHRDEVAKLLEQKAASTKGMALEERHSQIAQK